MTARIDRLFPDQRFELDDDALRLGYDRVDRSVPWLRVNFVSSVDGAATIDGVSAGLGDDADRRVFDLLRGLCDVVIVGAGTVRDEGYAAMRLDAATARQRVARGLAEHPVFAIVSQRLDLDPASPVFADAPVRPIIVTTGASPRERRAELSAVADVIVAGDDALDPAIMRAELATRGLTQQHCEGGPSLFGTLLAAGGVDELCLTVSAQLAAGEASRIAVGALAEPSSLRLGQVLLSGSTLLLRYEVCR